MLFNLKKILIFPKTNYLNFGTYYKLIIKYITDKLIY